MSVNSKSVVLKDPPKNSFGIFFCKEEQMRVALTVKHGGGSIIILLGFHAWLTWRFAGRSDL